MKKLVDNFVIWVAILIFVTLLYSQFGDNSSLGSSSVKLSFSDFLNQVEAGQVDRVVIHGDEIVGKLKSGGKFTSKVILYNGLLEELRKNNVGIDINSGDTFLGLLGSILVSWFPILLLIGVWIFFMKQVHSGGSKSMGFGKSKARLAENKKKIMFSDVAGVDEAKEDMMEVVDFLRDPTKFKALGGQIPKGCLLIGSPGTGKTLLAKAIAGEANVPFFSISGSDFVEMFVGVGASRVRDMFEQGKKNAPCIIFIDEIDAVGRHRGIGLGGGNDEREQTLNQLLVEMDGFEENTGVIIVAATNRPDVLDKALLRPGRFDRQIVISLPDIKGREQIIDVHIKKIQAAPDVSSRLVARGTPGFSGADLANLVNEAALFAARMNKKLVTNDDFEHARDKVMMGAERKSLMMKEEEKKLTAYHEAGHALVSVNFPVSDPIHKATIIPRGRALGLVMRLPEDDRVSLTREKILADLAVAMGGRVAEEIVFGYNKVTSGASSDIEQATNLSRSMVMKWGMSEKAGLVCYDGKKDSVGTEAVSESLLAVIDEEVRSIVDKAYAEATKILTDNLDKLHVLAAHLFVLIQVQVALAQVCLVNTKL